MEENEFTPAQPVQVLGFFKFELCKDANGEEFFNRTVENIPSDELIIAFETIKLDMLLQMNTYLAERTKRTIITRTVVEKPAE